MISGVFLPCTGALVAVAIILNVTARTDSDRRRARHTSVLILSFWFVFYFIGRLPLILN